MNNTISCNEIRHKSPADPSSSTFKWPQPLNWSIEVYLHVFTCLSPSMSKHVLQKQAHFLREDSRSQEWIETRPRSKRVPQCMKKYEKDGCHESQKHIISNYCDCRVEYGFLIWSVLLLLLLQSTASHDDRSLSDILEAVELLFRNEQRATSCIIAMRPCIICWQRSAWRLCKETKFMNHEYK